MFQGSGETSSSFPLLISTALGDAGSEVVRSTKDSRPQVNSCTPIEGTRGTISSGVTRGSHHNPPAVQGNPGLSMFEFPRSGASSGSAGGLSSGELAPVVAAGNNGGAVANASAATTAYDGVCGSAPSGGVPGKGRPSEPGPSHQAFSIEDMRQDSSTHALWAALSSELSGDEVDGEVSRSLTMLASSPSFPCRSVARRRIFRGHVT